MAQISLTIPDAVLARVVDAISTRFGYNPAVDGTKAQFAKAQLVKWLKAQVVEHEGNTAGALASKSAADSAATQVVIT